MATIVSTTRSARTKLPARSEIIRPATDDYAGATTDDLLRALHLTRPDGASCFGDHTAAPELQRRRRLLAAVREDGDAQLASVARKVERRDGRPAAQCTGKITPAVSYHSETLRTSVLRTDWSPSAAQLAVDWSEPDLRCDLVAGRDVLMSGVLPPRASVDGRRLNAVGAWEEICWDTDADADYLELEIALERGLRLQRQFLLTRTDGLLFVADALLSTTPAELGLESVLPFAATTKATCAEETREGGLTTGRRKRLVVPLGLPEWRSDRRRGEFAIDGDRAMLRQSSHRATALFAPLCIVLDPRRAGRTVTWRQLTIGENLQIQPADRAVGYRLQLGREQWLFYRSLTPRANRTVLGVNLQTNFLCARVQRNGEIEQLMEIED